MKLFVRLSIHELLHSLKAVTVHMNVAFMAKQ